MLPWEHTDFKKGAYATKRRDGEGGEGRVACLNLRALLRMRIMPHILQNHWSI